ncbi:MAG: hypothetical protein KDJ39_01765 [Gammaproteobacteria bacterium]|nr:hypothetical protein [Gammaproteobacteria bacterium]
MEQSIGIGVMVRATISACLRFAAAAILCAAIAFMVIGGQDRALMFTPFGVMFGVKYAIEFGLYVGVLFSLLFWIKAYRKGFCTGRICMYLVNHGALLGIAIVFVSHLPTAVVYIAHPVEFTAEYSLLLVWSMTIASFSAGLLGGYFSAPVLGRAASGNVAK